MKADTFTRAMTASGLAEKTVYMRVNALKRVEVAHDVDLDEEYDRDGMRSLLDTFSYTAQDERHNRPNPTKMNIGQRSVLSVVRWYKSHLNQYRKYRVSGGALEPEGVEYPDHDGSDGSAVDPEFGESSDTLSSAPARFALEADLQAALRDSIEQLEPGLEIVDGGLERKVASGFIDILARDAAGCFVVIELKAGTARDAVIAQVLGYMGDLAEETDAEVRGIVIAADFRPRVESAARAIPNLALKSYRYTFEFY